MPDLRIMRLDDERLIRFGFGVLRTYPRRKFIGLSFAWPGHVRGLFVERLPL